MHEVLVWIKLEWFYLFHRTERMQTPLVKGPIHLQGNFISRTLVTNLFQAEGLMAIITLGYVSVPLLLWDL